MNDRRYNETEVARIFEKATELQDARKLQLPASEGMTLAELQDIGREVGIAPEALAGMGKNSKSADGGHHCADQRWFN